MSSELDPTLILLGLAALFIFWRLRAVLGQRSGTERPTQQTETPNTMVQNVVSINRDPPLGLTNEDSATQQALKEIKKLDPEFTIPHFIEGAKIAHETILDAFANGKLDVLKSLLAPLVFQSFAAEIQRMKTENLTRIHKFVGINSANISSAELESSKATIAVQFESDMISAIIDQNQKPLTGDPNLVRHMSEVWSFERVLNSKDPNWKLVGTGAESDPEGTNK